MFLMFQNAVKSLEDLNQEILELTKNSTDADKIIAQLQNRVANKRWAQDSTVKSIAESKSQDVASKNQDSENATKNSKDSDDFKKQIDNLTGNYANVMHEKMIQAAKDLVNSGHSQEFITRFQSQQWDDIHKKELDSRIGLESNFTDYLRDKMASDTGLYKSNLGRRMDEWGEYYESLKGLSGKYGKDINTGLTDYIFDGLKGNGVKAKKDWSSMVDQMRKDVIDSVIDIGQTWAKSYIYKPLIGAPDMPQEGVTKPAAAAGSGVPESYKESLAKPAAAGTGAKDSATVKINKLVKETKDFGVAKSQEAIDSMIPNAQQYGGIGVLAGSGLALRSLFRICRKQAGQSAGLALSRCLHPL